MIGNALERLLDSGRAGTTIRVSPDPARAPMAAAEAVRRFAAAARLGSRRSLLGGGLLAYARTVAPGVVLIALDTADRAGRCRRRRPAAEQLSWLAAQLRVHAGSTS